jgi:predicted phage terminase large subunit-like protein
MEGVIYVLDIARGHWDFPTIMKRVEADALAWKPIKIGIESNGFQRMIGQGLQPKLLPIIDIKQSRNKEERIRSLSPNFENGRIRISKAMDDLILEYLHFPRGETVDILDALEMGVRMIVTTPAFPQLTRSHQKYLE